jgi:phage/plasmid-associated DNA primase
MANCGNEEGKIRLDLKYKSIEQIRKRNLHNSIKNDMKEDVIKNLKGIVEGDDSAAAEVIIKHHPNWKNCNGILYVHNPKTGLWSDSKNVQNSIISTLSEHLNIISLDGTKLTGKNYAKCHKKKQDIYPMLMEKTIDDDWIQRTETSSLGYLLYKNGWYDLRNNVFYPSTTNAYNPDIVFTYAIEHDYVLPDAEQLDYMEDIRKRLFCLSLGENAGNYFLLQIARGLAGDVMKRILFGLGVSNSGKSVLCKAIQLSCGQYIGSYNAENLSMSMSSSDEAQKMRWTLLLKDKRIILSNEVATNTDLNGTIIKKISSGGDPLTGRLHGGLETQFKPQFLAVVFANDLPDIKPYDDAVNNRVRIGNFEKTFVDMPTNSYELKKDLNLDNEMATLKFQTAFVNLLVKIYTDFIKNGNIEYEPEEVINAKKDWIGDDKEHSIIGKLLNDYEITDNIHDYVTSEDLKYWLKSIKSDISSKKLGIELKRYCNINEFSNVESKTKSISGKKCCCWSGIKLIQEVEECDDNKTEGY